MVGEAANCNEFVDFFPYPCHCVSVKNMCDSKLSPTSSLRLHFDDMLSENENEVIDERKTLWGIMPVPPFIAEKLGPWIDNNAELASSNNINITYYDCGVLKKVGGVLCNLLIDTVCSFYYLYTTLPLLTAFSFML